MDARRGGETRARQTRMIPTLRAALGVALACAAPASPVLAAEATVRLGDAVVRFDRARWRADVAGDSIRFEPQGEGTHRVDPVELHVTDDAPCPVLAERAFAFGHYDARDPVPVAIAIAGISGERFAARTGCRNATPTGVVVCMKVAGRAYLLQSLNPGCEGRNLFSGIDPLAEIAAGVSFSTGAP